MPYLGKTPSQATRQRYYKTASGGETSLSGTMTVGGTLTFNDGEFVDVSVNGVALVAGTDYNTTTANTIGGLSALSANDQVEIIVYDTFSVFGGNVDGDFNLNNGTMTLTRDDNEPQLIIKSTDADASGGPEIELFRESASPADDDALGKIQFKGKNDAAEELTYAEVNAIISDASDGTEDGELRLQVKRAGTTKTGLSLGPTETVFNDAGIDNDFRIESDNYTHALFVQGSDGHIGINNSAPADGLHINENVRIESTSPVIRFKETDGSANENFQVRVASGDLLFQTNNDAFDSASGVLELEKGGDVSIIDGNLKVASGHGIDFSATANAGNSASMSAELLDDYEEGSWTPSPNASTGNSPSFGSVSGLYTKIGRMVFIRGQIANIDTSGTTASAQLRVDGLPFAVDGSFGIGAAISDNITLQGGRTQLNIQVSTSDYITFTQSGNSLSETPTDMADIDASTSDIFFSAFYYSNE